MTTTVTTTLTADTVSRYRRLRRDGMDAVHAYRCASAPPPALRYRSGPGDAITILLDDRPDAAGFTVTAVAQPDLAPDISWLGEFTDTWSADAIEVNRHDRTHYRYFLPTYTLEQRRADLVRLGYARGPAHELALQQVREDARLAHDLDLRIVHVEARKARVLLGEPALGTTFAPNEDLDTAMAEVIDEHGLVDEAVEQARAALLPLIAALAA